MKISDEMEEAGARALAAERCHPDYPCLPKDDERAEARAVLSAALGAQAEALELPGEPESDYAHGYSQGWTDRGDREAETLDPRIEEVRLYCENQGDKFRYHAGRILDMLGAQAETPESDAECLVPGCGGPREQGVNACRAHRIGLPGTVETPELHDIVGWNEVRNERRAQEATREQVEKTGGE